MSAGRTRWWSKDAAWWRRDRIVEVGQAHGPAGPAVVDWLTCEAKSQGPLRGHDGTVKAGYAAVAYGCFIASADDVRAIVASCVEVGLLDDFVETGRTFTCRISGWHNDVEKPLEASRKATQRAGTSGDIEGQAGTTSPDVPKCPPTEQGHNTSSLRSEDARAGDERKSKRRRPEPVDADSLPDDLPERLHPVAEQVVTVLARVAAAKGAKTVTRAAVGRAVAAYPTHNHVRIAGEFEHWWVHGTGGNRTMRDVVLTYRNRLDQLPAGPPALAAVPAMSDEEWRKAVLK